VRLTLVAWVTVVVVPLITLTPAVVPVKVPRMVMV